MTLPDNREVESVYSLHEDLKTNLIRQMRWHMKKDFVPLIQVIDKHHLYTLIAKTRDGKEVNMRELAAVDIEWFQKEIL